MRKTLRIRITGKVQGVWYRQHTREKALELGVSGWVCNESDGSVSVTATGDASVLEKLVDWCHTGSPRSQVSGITIQEELLQEFDSFIIKRL